MIESCEDCYCNKCESSCSEDVCATCVDHSGWQDWCEHVIIVIDSDIEIHDISLA